MANEVLQKFEGATPKQISFADHAGDFAPTAANDLEQGNQTNCQIALASVTDFTATPSTGIRQSAKVDLGSVRAAAYAVKAAIEIGATPTAGEPIEIYWAPSPDATPANGNPGGVSGSDSAYTGYSSNGGDSIKQCELIGVFICTAQATGTVQVADCGVFSPSERYGTLLVKNESGATLHSDDVESHIVFNPIVDEVQ